MGYEWRGQTYATQKAVANAAGCTPENVGHCWRKWGNLDRLGIGRGAGSKEPLRLTYEWRGETYRGQKAVAKAAGVDIRTVTEHLRRYGDLKKLGEPVYCPRGRTPANATPVMGFPSITALARHIGFSLETVRQWIIRGDYERIYAELMRVDAGRKRVA